MDFICLEDQLLTNLFVFLGQFNFTIMKSPIQLIQICIFCLSASIYCTAQTPFGIKLNTEEAFDGYILFENDNHTYLMDNCGNILNQWFNINQTDNHTKLLDNGNMVYIYNNGVYEVDWNGATQNFVTHTDEDLLLEYEVELTTEGNYICVARRDYSPQQFEALGYDIPETFPTRVDVVVELDRNTGEIVWEWNITDHVIQERNPSANNYGALNENPGRINLDAISTFDWRTTESFMINSMDYNPTLDQVIISVRKLCEVMIIDHSTTTEEAKGNSGGVYGKGGDVLFRWGNPRNYGMGTEADQKLFYQHNPHWLTSGPYAGHIMIYNNGLNRPETNLDNRYSEVPIIAPPIDEAGNYIMDNGVFGPETPVVNYQGNNPAGIFYSGYTSGAEYLPNGNIYITEGRNGRLLELSPTGELVWEYFVYDHDYIFRSEKYSKYHPAFEGRSLEQMGTLEDPPSEYACSLYVGVDDQAEKSLDIKIAHHPSNHPEVIVFNPSSKNLHCTVFDLFGRELIQLDGRHNQLYIDLGSLHPNTYVLNIQDKEQQLSKSFKLIKI